jgi:hypothetical protein
VYFAQETIDWSKPFSQRYSQTRIPAKECTKADFGDHPKQISVFENWRGFSLICPDLQAEEGFYIKGDSDSMVTHSYQFQIDRCNNTIQHQMGRQACHSNHLIDNWIKDVDI